MSVSDRIPGRSYQGAAVHWPGIKGRLGLVTHELCRVRLRAIEADQMDRDPPPGEAPYGAIAYQVVVCPHARVIEGRTRRKRNGANGSLEANTDFGSILVLVGTDDPVTDDMKAAILGNARAYLGVDVLKTHNQVRPSPTACPGPELTRWIEDGYPEEDMPTAAEIAAATVALLMKTPMENRVKQATDPDATSSYKSLIEGTYLRAYMAADTTALAAALAADLPTGVQITDDQLDASLRRVLGSLDADAG